MPKSRWSQTARRPIPYCTPPLAPHFLGWDQGPLCPQTAAAARQTGFTSLPTPSRAFCALQPGMPGAYLGLLTARCKDTVWHKRGLLMEPAGDRAKSLQNTTQDHHLWKERGGPEDHAERVSTCSLIPRKVQPSWLFGGEKAIKISTIKKKRVCIHIRNACVLICFERKWKWSCSVVSDSLWPHGL